VRTAGGELTELLECELQVVADAREHGLSGGRILAEGFLGDSQVHREGDEPLLRAVVQVALESSALGHACFDDACARGGQLVVCFGALERERDEVREVGQTLLRVRREMISAR
jgi:hypothetical protein